MMANKSFLLTLFSLSFIFLVGCGKTPPPEPSCNFVTNRFNRRVAWAQTPIRFYVDSSVGTVQYRDIVTAMGIWNRQFDRPIFEMIGRSKALPAPRIDGGGETEPDGYNGIYMVSENIFDEYEQARTSIAYRGDDIYEADILIDASESFFYGSGQNISFMEKSSKVSFLSLVVHELGHALGLDHNENASSVMYSKLVFGEYRVDITDSDFESISCEYQ